MPVKVTSDGPKASKRVVCKNCTYELEFTGEDVHYHCDSDGDTSSWIICPRETCRTKGYNRELIPTRVFVKWP